MQDNKDYVKLEGGAVSGEPSPAEPDINEAESGRNVEECSKTREKPDTNPAGTQGDPPERGPVAGRAEADSVRERLPLEIAQEIERSVPALLDMLVGRCDSSLELDLHRALLRSSLERHCLLAYEAGKAVSPVCPFCGGTTSAACAWCR